MDLKCSDITHRVAVTIHRHSDLGPIGCNFNTFILWLLYPSNVQPMTPESANCCSWNEFRLHGTHTGNLVWRKGVIRFFRGHRNSPTNDTVLWSWSNKIAARYKMKHRVHNIWTSMMMIASVGPAHQGRMWKYLEWENWFCAVEAKLGRPPIPRQQGSGNDCSWMVANVNDRFLKRHNFYNRAMMDKIHRCPRGLPRKSVVHHWKK